MQLVEWDITFSDDVKAVIHAAMATGQYVYEDEVVATALYLLLQDMASRDQVTAQSKTALKQPLDEMRAELRQALDEQYGRLEL